VLGLLAFAASGAAQSHTVQYTYDALDRLTSVRYADRVVEYSYDAAGNRLSMTVLALNPIPAVIGVSPVVVAPATETVTATVTGTGFVDGSVVRWNGQPRVTAFVSATEIRAALLPVDFGAAGGAALSVFNPAPGGGESAVFNLTVLNPLPAVASVSPPAAVVGSAGLTLAVTGSGFVNGSSVRWNGAARPTAYVGWTRVDATIPASDLAALGSATVTVVNPAPGGGASPSGATILIRQPAPTVASIVPSSGPTAGGTLVTVTGTGFQAGASLTLGGVAADGVAVVSPTSITGTTGAHGPATVDVVVTNPDQQAAVLPSAFTYSTQPITPVVAWANPANIVVGTPLGPAQLNATADVPGTFVYDPPAGTVLGVGLAQSLSVTFTPADTASYTTTTKTVLIDVVSSRRSLRRYLKPAT